MTRQPPAGPSWREPPRPPELDDEQVFVACRCGTDMQFRWPRGQADVRCFACGVRFPRPGHLPASPVPPWRPAPARRPWLTRASLLMLGLTALLAGLLGAAIALAWR